MYQGSDLISDIRARRIRTQITWEILLANSHEVTVTYLKPVSLRHCQCRSRWQRGLQSTKNGGMIRDSFPGINSPGQAPVEHARGFSGSRARLQWSFSGGFSGGVGLWVGGGVLGPLAPSEFVGKSWEILEPVAKSWEPPAGNSRNFRRHRSRVHQSRGGIFVT